MKITVVGWLLIGAAVVFAIVAVKMFNQPETSAPKQDPQKPILPYPGGFVA